MRVLNKITYTVTSTQQSIVRKLVGYKISVRGPHVARGPEVGPHWLKLQHNITLKRNPMISL